MKQDMQQILRSTETLLLSTPNDRKDIRDFFLFLVTWLYVNENTESAKADLSNISDRDLTPENLIEQIKKENNSIIPRLQTIEVENSLKNILRSGLAPLKKINKELRGRLFSMWHNFFKQNGCISQLMDKEGRIFFDEVEEFLASSWEEATILLNPSDLTSLIVGLANVEKIKSVHDPYCRTGSFLIEARFQFRDLQVLKGFTNDLFALNLAFLKFFMLGDHAEKIIKEGNIYTLGQSEYYDTIITNPPFGKRNIFFEGIGDQNGEWSHFQSINRYEVDYVCYSLNHLSAQGLACVIVPSSFLSGPESRTLREAILTKNLLEGVISLPPGFFYNASGVKAAILILSKRKATNKTIFIDATGLGFKKGDRNTFSKEDISQIIDLMKGFRKNNSFTSIGSPSSIMEPFEIENHGFSFDSGLYTRQPSKTIRRQAVEIWASCRQLEKRLAEVQRKISAQMEITKKHVNK